jgi:hypothetical protein
MMTMIAASTLPESVRDPIVAARRAARTGAGKNAGKNGEEALCRGW